MFLADFADIFNFKPHHSLIPMCKFKHLLHFSFPVTRAALATCSNQETEQERPNFLYIMCDDLTEQAIGYYGYPSVKMVM